MSLKILSSHSKSFKAIRNYTDEQGVCEVLLVIHCRPKYVSILYRYRHIGVTLKSALEVTQDY